LILTNFFKEISDLIVSFAKNYLFENFRFLSVVSVFQRSLLLPKNIPRFFKGGQKQYVIFSPIKTSFFSKFSAIMFIFC